MPDDITSPQFIQDKQYNDSRNLSARIRIHEFYCL